MRILPLLYRLLAVVLLCLFCATPVLAANTWTLALYLCGSDLETKYGAASLDLKELCSVKIPDNVNVVIQTGGAKKWQNTVVDGNRITRYLYKGRKLTKLESLAQASMGDGKTFSSFLRFCQQHFPAEHTAYIIWDHGGGTIGGVANDENYNNKALSLKEIRKALQENYTASETNPPIDLFGFDACLMGSFDVAHTLSGFSKYMVASQEVEPGNGWNWSAIMKALASPRVDAKSLGIAICDGYIAGCKEYDTEDNATLALIDLRYINELRNAINHLGIEGMEESVKSDSFYAAMGRRAKQAEHYHSRAGSGSANMLDLGSFVSRLDGRLKAAPDVLAALNKTVVYNVSGPCRSPSGLSIYYPFDGKKNGFNAVMQNGCMTSLLLLEGLQCSFLNKGEVQSYLKQIKIQARSTPQEQTSSNPSSQPEPREGGISSQPKPRPQGQTGSIGFASNLLQNLAALRPLGKLDISSLEDARVDLQAGRGAVLNLGPDKVRYLSEVSCYIAYFNESDDIILFLGKDANIQADWQNGIFKDKFHGVWPCLNGHLLCTDVIARTTRRYTYSAPIKLNGIRCDLIFSYDLKDSRYRLLGARPLKEGATAAKTLLKLRPGDKVTTIFKAMRISTASGEVRDVPIDTFTLSGNTLSLMDEDLGDGDFIYMFEMADVQGNTALSKVVTIKIAGEEITFSDPDEESPGEEEGEEAADELTQVLSGVVELLNLF